MKTIAGKWHVAGWALHDDGRILWVFQSDDGRHSVQNLLGSDPPTESWIVVPITSALGLTDADRWKTWEGRRFRDPSEAFDEVAATAAGAVEREHGR